MNNVITMIQDAIKALYAEIKAIGKDHRTSQELVEGRLLGVYDRSHVCAFRAPPASIADGLPVTLLVEQFNRDARRDPGCVVGYQGGEVVISSPDNPSLASEHSSIRHEPGRLLEALRKRLTELQDSPANANFALLAKLFAAPEPADPPDDANKPTAALVDAALVQPVSFLWSPPGTDQNGFIAACATRIAAEGGSVLILNDTTAQTDAQTLLLADSPAAKTIVRVGAPMPDALKALQDLSPHSIARRRDPRAFQVLDRLTQQIAELQGAADWRMESPELQLKLDELEREKGRLEQLALKAEQAVVESASIVISPINRAMTHEWVYGRSYEVVIVGNAHNALLPQLIWVATLARKTVILAGDFRRTPNWVRSYSEKVVRWLTRNIFEASGVVESVNCGGWDSRLLMLRTQQTTHPQISRIVSKLAYGGRLLDALEAAERTAVITNQPPEPGHAIVFYDVRHLQPHAHKGEPRGSCSNLLTAALSVRLVGALQSQGKRSILLASPYRDHWLLHQALMRNLDLQDCVTTTPLYRCVGPQHDVVILDLVYTEPLRHIDYLLSGGLGSEFMRQLTTAVSSARGKFIVLGDYNRLQQTLVGIAALRGFLREMQFSGAVFKPFPSDLLYSAVGPKNPAFYADPEEAWFLIAQDIGAATQRVMWNWPFANAGEVFNPNSQSWMFSAQAIRALAIASDDPAQHPLTGYGVTVARSVRAEAGVQIDDNIFWLIGNSYPDGTTRPFVRFSGRRVALQITQAFGLNAIFPKVNFRSWPTRQTQV